MEQQVCVLFAANQGFLDDVAVEEVGAFEKRLLEYLKNQGKDVLKEIRESKDITDETQEKLKKLIHAFK